VIHYHGVPLSGGLETEIAMKGKHGFVSYAHASSVGLVAEICQTFALDNGAFSAWKSGKAFDVKGFAAFVSEWHTHPGLDWYVIPDAIDGDDDANARMRATWFKTVGAEVYGKGVPVWHLNESLDVLQYMTVAYDRIAFGSAGAYSQIGSQEWWARMSEAMDIVCDSEGRPKVKLHGLRMLDPTIFSHFPFSSADSTNVGRNCGIDKAWRGPYTGGLNSRTRAMILMDRIESHASATRWSKTQAGQKNFELIG
tara:strand:- start:660 stop:1418 length:759 start_codon:yes stop_codon:yes gene_type:complete